MKRSISWIALLALVLAGSRTQEQPAQAAQSPGGGGLKSVKNPGGGEFVYGALDREAGSSKLDAMRFMLRMVHGHFGEPPQLGRFFQSHDGTSLGTFFTVNDVNHGRQPLAGLAIVCVPKNAGPRAAVLYDSVKRFPTTEPVMMRALSKAWIGENRTAPPVRLARLVWVTGGDRSAFIKLPEDWWLTAVGHGMLMAEGPHGEQLVHGGLYQNILDPRLPGAQQMAAWAARTRGSGGPQYFYCPLSNDLFSAFATLVNQDRSYHRQPAATYNLVSQQAVPGPGPIPSIEAVYTADFHDGIGLRKGVVHLDAQYVQGAPTWGLWISGHNIPERYEQAEGPRMREIARTFTQDTALMQRQTDIQVREIEAGGERARQRTRELNQQTADLREHMMDSHNDLENWTAKLTENYTLENSVVRDVGDNWHIHADDRFADQLVKGNPGVLEYCPNVDLVPGRDY